jgi:hypothetical protein
MNQRSLAHMMDKDIVEDVLSYIWENRQQFELHKITKRREVAQAAYAVAKVFGFRSAFHDLRLTHPSMTHHVLAGVDDVIPVPGVKGVEVYWRLTILGQESKAGSVGTSTSDRLSGNSTMANQIEVDVRRGFKFIVVNMEMTGTAFFNLCVDCGNKTGLARHIKQMLKEKWGSSGTKYGLFKGTDSNIDNEGYRFVRMMDGVPKVYQRGWNGWVNA